MTATLFFESRARLAECPYWSQSEERLYWTNIPEGEIHRFHLESQVHEVCKIDSLVSSVVLTPQPGIFLAAFKSGLGLVEFRTGKIFLLNELEIQFPENSFNDGKCDAKGRYWVGSKSSEKEKEKPSGNLYCLEPDFRTYHLEANLGVSNGLGWSPDNRVMYHTDSLTKTIYRYDFDLQTGAISNREPFIVFEKETPDGLTIDSAGNLWSAIFGGGCIKGHSPKGDLIGKIEVPAPQTTSCCFGGKDLKTLFITTGCKDLSPQQLKEFPLSGSLFQVPMDIPGLATFPFSGDVEAVWKNSGKANPFI